MTIKNYNFIWNTVLGVLLLTNSLSSSVPFLYLYIYVLHYPGNSNTYKYEPTEKKHGCIKT